MESIISIIGIIVIIYLFYAVPKAKLKVTKELGYDYIIRFRDVDTLPDLEQNPNLKSNLKIYSSSDDHFAVQSHLNDTKLTEIILSDYHLQPHQVTVQSIQLSGPVGAL